MAQIETAGGKPKAPPTPAPAPVRAARPARKVVRRPAPRPRPVIKPKAVKPAEKLSVEEWAEKIKAEEEAAATKAKQEEVESQTKLLTKEQFIAMMQTKAAAAQQQPAAQVPQKPVQQQRKSIFLGRLSANVDTALGIVPKPQDSAGKSEAAIKIMQQTQQMQQAPAPALQEMGAGNANLEEIGSVSGIIGNIKANPIIAGAFAFIGLLLALVGTYLNGSEITALAIEVIGVGIFFFGMIFIFVHARKMRGQTSMK